MPFTAAWQRDSCPVISAVSVHVSRQGHRRSVWSPPHTPPAHPVHHTARYHRHHRGSSSLFFMASRVILIEMWWCSCSYGETAARALQDDATGSKLLEQNRNPSGSVMSHHQFDSSWTSVAFNYVAHTNLKKNKKKKHLFYFIYLLIIYIIYYYYTGSDHI